MTEPVTSGEPQRILHAIAPNAMGGAERVVHDSAVGQQDRGQSVGVLALLDPDGPDPWLVTALRSRRISTYTCRATLRGYFTEIKAIRHWVRQMRPDVVHCHAYRADVLGRLALKGLPPAMVATAHGFTGGGLKNRCYEWLDRRTLRRFDSVIAVSAQLESRLRRSGVSGERVRLVQNAFLPLPLVSRAEARAKLGLEQAGAAVGWIGRVEPEKGPDLFVQALSRLQQRGVQAAVIGDGRERGSVELAVRELGLEDRVRMTGAIPNAGELLSAFDVVVLSSRTEGLPISLLEAMSAAIPVVATAVGDVPAATANGKFVQLVPSEDPGALAAAIDRTLADGARAVAVARQASDWVRAQFGSEAWLDRIDETYRWAMRQRARR
ncbi:MAG: glycosyltransferase [Gemmatimonadota bacterium]|nr:MAG: glycosyltransferase [Gemmatimonadota bacterium]